MNIDTFICPPKTQSEWHSDLIDIELGFNITAIENSLEEAAKRITSVAYTYGRALHENNQTWVGVGAQSILTPYSDIVSLLNYLQCSEGDHIVDLGCAYGRMGVVLHYYPTNIKFSGFEYVAERVDEGNRILSKIGSPSKLEKVDLVSPDFVLPDADVYFIYDYGAKEHIRHTLKQLQEQADKKPFKLVIRGNAMRSLVLAENPWLKLIRHDRFSSIFTSDQNYVSTDYTANEGSFALKRDDEFFKNAKALGAPIYENGAEMGWLGSGYNLEFNLIDDLLHVKWKLIGPEDTYT